MSNGKPGSIYPVNQWDRDELQAVGMNRISGGQAEVLKS